MLKVAIILVLICVWTEGAAGSKPDPRCAAKNCPPNTTCRFVKICPTPQSCSLEPQCLESPPSDSHTGVCVMGDPVLVQNGQRLRDLTCGPRTPCLNGSYCNTELQDTYATCCMSDPEPVVKGWSCPPNTYTGDDFCLDTCIHDGDCRDNDKCCSSGCNVECIPQPDPCNYKTCPKNTYCQAANMPPCEAPGKCHTPGDCVACPPVCEMYCMHGNVLDPNGCPTCLCKPGPPPPPANPSTGNAEYQKRNSGSRLRMSWPGSMSGQQPWMSFIPPWLWAVLFM